MVALSEKQGRFVEEYIIDMNATKAAIRAGYSEKTAYSQGQRLSKHVEIKAAIQEAAEKRSMRTQITQDRVLLEFARLAFFDPRKLFDDDGKPMDISRLDDDTAAALVGLDMQEIYADNGDGKEFVGWTKKYKLADKKGALDSLGKHLGLFDNREAPTAAENNLFEAIKESAQEALKADDIPEIEQATAAGTDVVEPSSVQTP